MQISIACCDDERKQLDILQKYFDTLSVQIQADINVDYYLSGSILLQKCRSEGECYDIYILDIEMPEMDGMKLGEEIRKYSGKDALIMYLTNYPEYMHDSFSVQTFQYMIKGIEYEPFKSEIERAIRYLRNDNKSIIFKNTENEDVVFRLKNILYLEKEKGLNSMSVVHTNGKETVRGNMNTYEERLLDNGFAKISRGVLVNMDHIYKIIGDEIVLDNKIAVKASSRKMTEVRSLFAKYVMSGVL